MDLAGRSTADKARSWNFRDLFLQETQKININMNTKLLFCEFIGDILEFTVPTALIMYILYRLAHKRLINYIKRQQSMLKQTKVLK